MGSYGRHFDFRQPPLPQHRLGRYAIEDAVLIGAPVQVPSSPDVDAQGRLPLELCTSAVHPLPGKHGILIYEFPTPNKDGYDPVVTSFSDLDTAPAGSPVQLVHGTEVRVAYWNLEAVNFQDQRDYDARTMVAGMGATPTLAAGDMLTPGGGNDSVGYWVETADVDLAWILVTNVDLNIGLVEGQLLF